jgi:hypothetical protein
MGWQQIQPGWAFLSPGQIPGGSRPQWGIADTQADIPVSGCPVGSVAFVKSGGNSRYVPTTDNVWADFGAQGPAGPAGATGPTGATGPQGPAATLTINNNVARTLNSNFTISATQNALVSYSINAAWNVSALLSGSGSAFLEYSTNGGSTWITVCQVGKTLNLLTFAGQDDMNLSGVIPPNGLTRLRATSSNMTVTYTRGQEVLQ